MSSSEHIRRQQQVQCVERHEACCNEVYNFKAIPGDGQDHKKHLPDGENRRGKKDEQGKFEAVFHSECPFKISLNATDGFGVDQGFAGFSARPGAAMGVKL